MGSPAFLSPRIHQVRMTKEPQRERFLDANVDGMLGAVRLIKGRYCFEAQAPQASRTTAHVPGSTTSLGLRGNLLDRIE